MFEMFTWDWELVGANFLRMLLAFALAFPLAWERVKSQRSLGLRTFPIVAVASCGYMLIAIQTPDAHADTNMRALQGLLGGMGFIGGGAILKSGGSVRGLATAASLWSTGAIGAAVAFRREEIAVVLAIGNFALLRFLKPLKEAEKEQSEDDDDS
jgi:putative Mg2+ transporter-C (MgtC) family protein